MKTVVTRQMYWVVPTVFALLASMSANAPAAPATESKPAKAPKTAKTPKPRSKTADGTLSQASATSVKLKADDGELNINLMPTTEFWRVQTGLKPTDLQVGDTVKFTLKGTDDMATVQSLSPLTLKFGEEATLVLNAPAKMKFDRVSKLAATDLVAGQTAKIASNLFPDGHLEAREVWVIVAPTKPEKKAATTTPTP